MPTCFSSLCGVQQCACAPANRQVGTKTISLSPIRQSHACVRERYVLAPVCNSGTRTEATYHIEVTSFEFACELVSTRVLELAFAVHEALAEAAFVLVALRPREFSFAIHNIMRKLAGVAAAIGVHGSAVAVLLVTDPAALVLGNDAILVWLAAVDLKTMTVSNHLKRLQKDRVIPTLGEGLF